MTRECASSFDGGTEGLALLAPKIAFRPASYTALALRSVQPVPREGYFPPPSHRSRGPGKQDEVLLRSPKRKDKGMCEPTFEEWLDSFAGELARCTGKPGDFGRADEWEVAE